MNENNLKIRIGGIYNLIGLRFAAGVGADIVGFNLSLNLPNYVDPLKIKEMMGWIQGPILVGQFSILDGIDYINSVCQELDLNLIELDKYDLTLINQLSDHGYLVDVPIENNPDEVMDLSLIHSLIINQESLQYFDTFNTFVNIQNKDTKIKELPNGIIGVNFKFPNFKEELDEYMELMIDYLEENKLY